MAMRIMHDASAALAVTELNKNANNLQKDLKKVASGMRINSAADDASGYAIGERMAVRLRALNQDIINTQTGSDLIRVAEGGVQSVIEELRTLKELALNSINDHNSELDRATLQKEFEHRTANIDNIANETEYNGRILLNGDYRRKFLGASTIPAGRNVLSTNTVSSTATSAPVTSSSTKTSVQTSKPVTKTTRSTTTTTSDTMPTTGTTEGTPTSTTTTSNSTSVVGPTPSVTSNTVTNDIQTTDNGDGTFTEVKTDVTTRATTNTTVTTDTETTTTVTTKVSTIVSATPVTGTIPDTPIIIKNGTISITANGIYEFAPDYTGTLTISASNVEIMGPSSGAILNEVYLVDDGLDDLYLKNVIIENTQDKSAIAFDLSTANTLHLLGSNSISASGTTMTATINAGGGLSIVGNGSLDIVHLGRQQGAMIGSDFDGSCGDITIGQQVSISATKTQYGANGAGIGSGGGSASCGNISIGTDSNITIDMNDYHGIDGYTCATAIGSGNGFISGNRPKCGNIVIYSGAHVSAISGAGAGIGSSVPNSDCGNITIYSNSTVNAASRMSAGIGSGANADARYLSKCGDITIYSYPSGYVQAVAHNNFPGYYSADIGLGDNRGFNEYGMVGSVNLLNTTNNSIGGIADFSEPELGSTTVTSYEVTTETITTTTTTVTTKETKTTEYETVTDTITGTTTTVYEPKEEIIEHYNAPLIIHTGTKANQHLRVYIEDMRPEALGIDKAKIDPQEAAIESLAIIDGAIDYAIEQATHLGAYISRLGHTENTLTADSENTQASESTIRDADMAMEMMRYTKDNILAQTAQAMLAQANQNASSVLNLLQ